MGATDGPCEVVGLLTFLYVSNNFAFFPLNAIGGVAVLGKVMVNLYLWGEGGEEMGAGDVVQKRSTTQYFQGENKLERKQITLCLVCHHGFLCHTEGG